MPVDSASLFATVIQEHLELRRRNAALEHEMPLQRYMPDDPFENHPLFKTEEQARIEDTMDGNQSIVDEPTSLEWPTTDSFPEAPIATIPAPVPAAPEAEPEAEEEQSVDEPTAEEPAPEQTDEGLWSRSRDFDWGD